VTFTHKDSAVAIVIWSVSTGVALARLIENQKSVWGWFWFLLSVYAVFTEARRLFPLLTDLNGCVRWHVVHKDSEIGVRVRAGDTILTDAPSFDHEKFASRSAAQTRCVNTQCIPVIATFSGKSVTSGPNRGAYLWYVRKA